MRKKIAMIVPNLEKYCTQHLFYTVSMGISYILRLGCLFVMGSVSCLEI